MERKDLSYLAMTIKILLSCLSRDEVQRPNDGLNLRGFYWLTPSECSNLEDFLREYYYGDDKLTSRVFSVLKNGYTVQE